MSLLGLSGLGLSGLGLLVACGEEPARPGHVSPAAAYTAIVQWQADQQEPVLDDQGEAQLPVIYVVADDDGSIDVGVQAGVAAATVDMAVVRFADESTDAFDMETEGEPVKDQGSLLLVQTMPPPARVFDVDIVRYTSADQPEPLRLQVSADSRTDDGATATVTSVTPP
jgi:hypothetical protein